jgi:HTH-type transcriptional regulator / antitoxin HigA
MIKKAGKMMNGFDAYTRLLVQFPPRPLDSEAAYWETQAVIDKLLAQASLTAAEQDYLSLLGMLIEKYDEAQQVFPALRGVALLKTLIEELNLQPAVLLPIFRTDAVVAAVLSGRRKLTIEQIEGLSHFFQLPPAVFFEEAAAAMQDQPYRPFEPIAREVMVQI